MFRTQCLECALGFITLNFETWINFNIWPWFDNNDNKVTVGNIVNLHPCSVTWIARYARAANDTTRVQINNIPFKSHFIPLLYNHYILFYPNLYGVTYNYCISHMVSYLQCFLRYIIFVVVFCVMGVRRGSLEKFSGYLLEKFRLINQRIFWMCSFQTTWL